jgi:hypothetical protein
MILFFRKINSNEPACGKVDTITSNRLFNNENTHHIKNFDNSFSINN